MTKIVLFRLGFFGLASSKCPATGLENCDHNFVQTHANTKTKTNGNKKILHNPTPFWPRRNCYGDLVIKKY